MNHIITYLWRAGIFHMSVLFYEHLINTFLIHRTIPLLIMNIGWTIGGLIVFYIYSSNVLVKTLRRPDTDQGSLDRALYNLTELYSIYIIAGLLSLGIPLINSIANGLFIAQLWLAIHGYYDKPVLSIAKSNIAILWTMGLFIEAVAFDRLIHNLYMVPLLNGISLLILDRYPLNTTDVVVISDKYVRNIWSYILNVVKRADS